MDNDKIHLRYRRHIKSSLTKQEQTELAAEAVRLMDPYKLTSLMFWDHNPGGPREEGIQVRGMYAGYPDGTPWICSDLDREIFTDLFVPIARRFHLRTFVLDTTGKPPSSWG